MQAPEDVAQLADLTFSYLADNSTYMKAFCLAPPKDRCPFRVPCPNNDVTGLGQQVSIYITTIMYGIVLVYIPKLQREMLYAHLSIIYSLLIAALISIVKDELSHGDGIFVIVTAASPASLYLWYFTIKSLLCGAHHFPMRHSNKGKSVHRSREIRIAQALAVLSLVFTVVMLCLVFTPNIPLIGFPQTACDIEFSATSMWYNVAWQLPVVIQSACMILFYAMAFGICWIITRRASYTVPSPIMFLGKRSSFELPTYSDKTSGASCIRRSHLDLISWTEIILFDQYPHFMNRTLFICIITNLQLYALPTFFLVVQSKDCFAVVIMAFGLFSVQTGSYKTWFIRIAVFGLITMIWILRFPILMYLEIVPAGFFLLPDTSAFMFLFVSWSAARWSWRNFVGSSMRIPLVLINVVFGIIIVVSNVLIITIGDPKSFSSHLQPPDGFVMSYLTLNLLPLILWIISWLSTSAWPWKQTLTWDKLNKGLWRRAHILKVTWIVICPHILWIQASNNTNLSRPMDMSFGQIFAIIVSAVTLFILLDEAKEVKKEIWSAFFKSDLMLQNDDNL